MPNCGRVVARESISSLVTPLRAYLRDAHPADPTRAGRRRLYTASRIPNSRGPNLEPGRMYEKDRHSPPRLPATPTRPWAPIQAPPGTRTGRRRPRREPGAEWG